jgi:hypothetical protein
MGSISRAIPNAVLMLLMSVLPRMNFGFAVCLAAAAYRIVAMVLSATGCQILQDIPWSVSTFARACTRSRASYYLYVQTGC